MKGKIIVFTGDGKGKTTAAFGMALRAAGHGKRVIIIQFLKKGEYGEIKAGVKGIEIFQFGKESFVYKPSKEDYEMAKQALKFAEEKLAEKPFMLILDEINVALSMGLIEVKDVVDLIEKRNESHIVLTGRNAPDEIIKLANLATEMKKIKHYYDKGEEGIEGLEY